MTPTLARVVAARAAAVRAELSDLPPSELDDLIDGLEADLAERADESPGDALGDPVEYAAELRAAAGYPPRAASRHTAGKGGVPTLRDARTFFAELASNWRAFVERHPVLRGAGSFLVALRPLWWVFRGWVGYFIVSRLWTGRAVLGDYLFEWIVLAVAVVLSVQYGRGRWFTRPSLRPLFVVMNVLVLVAAPAVLAKAADIVYWSVGPAMSVAPSTLNVNGVQVDNIYAYDADGNPIERVQLFDQDGDPLNLTGDVLNADHWGASDGSYVMPRKDVAGSEGWNVYPLDRVDAGTEGDPSLWNPESAPFPFERVRPLSGDSDSGTDPDAEADSAVPDHQGRAPADN